MNFLRRLFGKSEPQEPSPKAPEPSTPSEKPAAESPSDPPPEGQPSPAFRQARQALLKFLPHVRTETSWDVEQLKPGLGALFVQEGTGITYWVRRDEDGFWKADQFKRTTRDPGFNGEPSSLFKDGAEGFTWSEAPSPIAEEIVRILKAIFPKALGDAALDYVCQQRTDNEEILRVVFAEGDTRLTWHSQKLSGAPTTHIVIQIQFPPDGSVEVKKMAEDHVVARYNNGDRPDAFHHFERDNSTGRLFSNGLIEELLF